MQTILIYTGHAMPLERCDATSLPPTAHASKASAMPLDQLPRGQRAKVVGVSALYPNDDVAERLRNLGFVPGEPLLIVAHAPWGKDPILVEIGTTRFALRHAEANRVTVSMGECA